MIDREHIFHVGVRERGVAVIWYVKYQYAAHARSVVMCGLIRLPFNPIALLFIVYW